MYSRVVNGKTLTFGHEGILYRKSFIMYDRQTSTLWVHTTGQAIRGKLKGSRLEFIPSVVTTWGRWKRDHPFTTVLTGRKARGFMGSYSLAKKPRKYGLSVGQGEKVKLYPFSVLIDNPVINDTFEGRAIVVALDRETLTARAYSRGNRSFKLKEGKLVDGDGKAWDLLTGSGDEDTLSPLAATTWLTDRWRGFYPDSLVYRTEF